MNTRVLTSPPQITAIQRSQFSLKDSIDLVIVDLFMPGAGGGFNFIAMLCESYPNLPVIVLSASENPAHIRKCLDFGAIGFVTKSAPKDALFEAMSRALKGENTFLIPCAKPCRMWRK